MRQARLCFLTGMLAWCSCALAEDALSIEAQRDRRQEQWRVEMDACLKRFAVYACQADVTDSFQADDKVLRQRLLSMHRQQRLENAEQRRKEIEQRQETREQEARPKSQ